LRYQALNVKINAVTVFQSKVKKAQTGNVMPVKKSRSTYILLPGKQWYYRASLSMMVGLGIALMIMSKTHNPNISKIRMQISDAAVPVISVIGRPMDAFYDVGTWISEMVQLRQQNVLLKNQNVELLKWQAAAKAMEVENTELRKLMNVVAAHKSGYITARIVSDVGGPYVHSALMSGGSKSGIRKNQPVISENGLMGRVVDVGKNSSRVLLLNDINSRVPVIAENANIKSILVGNNTGIPSLSYLSSDSKIKVGDRIVTSGDGGVFPKGIPVGVVTSVEDGMVNVQPFVEPSRTEYVSIMDYMF
jgi:rod shape-determining protein MreC